MKQKAMVLTIILTILQLVAGWFGYSYINEVSNQGVWSFWWIVGVVVVTLAAIGVGGLFNIVMHELGHLFGGLLTGWSFNFFNVMGLTWLKEDGKIKLKFIKPNGLKGTVNLSPPDMRNGTLPYKLYLFGGALMNIVVAVAFFALFFHFARDVSFFARACLVVGLVGIDMGISNLLPTSGANSSDGYLILNLGSKKNKEMRLNFWRTTRLSTLNIRGTRPRHFPAIYFEEITTQTVIGDPYVFAVAMTKYEYLLDCEELGKAEAYLKAIYERADLSYQAFIQLHLLFHELIGACREEEVKRLHTKEVQNLGKAYYFNVGVQRVLYAYERLFVKDMPQVEAQLNAFHKACSKYSVSFGSMIGERELIGLIDEITDKKYKA